MKVENVIQTKEQTFSILTKI